VLGAGSFPVASDASEVHPMRRGALFAALLLDPVFLRKKLGMSREAAATTARRLAVTALARVRLDAVRTAIDFALAEPLTIEESASDALQVRVPRTLAGLIPRPSTRAPAELVGALLAAGDRETMRDQFDEDWFENPRALASLREVDATRPPSHVNDALDGAASRLAAGLEHAAH
jgi:hypothetical protein